MDIVLASSLKSNTFSFSTFDGFLDPLNPIGTQTLKEPNCPPMQKMNKKSNTWIMSQWCKIESMHPMDTYVFECCTHTYFHKDMVRQRVGVVEVHHKLELFDLEFFMPKFASVEDQRFLSSRCSIAKKGKHLHCRETVERRSLLLHSLEASSEQVSGWASILYGLFCHLICVIKPQSFFYIQDARREREGVGSGVNRL